MSKTPKSTFSLQNSNFRLTFFFDQNLDFVLGKDSHKRKKKLRSTELLAQAAMSTAEDLSRKGAKRAQRGIDQDPNAKTSKRIKL